MTRTPLINETARIVHQVPGRVRLRLSQLRGATDELAVLGDRLAAIAGIRRVDLNDRVGSVLVLHDLSPGDVGRVLSSVFEIVPAQHAARSLAVPAVPSIKHVAGAALLALGLVQLARGNIATPAVTSLWYAYNLLGDVHWPPLEALED